MWSGGGFSGCVSGGGALGDRVCHWRSFAVNCGDGGVVGRRGKNCGARGDELGSESERGSSRESGRMFFWYTRGREGI